MDEFIMNKLEDALFLAKKAAVEKEVPVGALVLKNNQVIGRGYNRREQLRDPIAHAEILAIQQASQNLGSWRLVDCVLVVTLEPCVMCLAACQQARVAEVIYGAQDLKGGALSLGYRLHENTLSNHRFLVRHVEYPSCSRILSDFFLALRKSHSP
jgi:tRNA(adenine34) deaminase